MAYLQIPTTLNFPFYTIDVNLDGVVYRLQFKFNDRDQAWYVSFFTTADIPLRTGIKIVSDWELLYLWQNVFTHPPGGLIAVAQAGGSDPATIDELGEDVVLTYIEESSLPV